MHKNVQRWTNSVFVVGIGASAGGLEALRQLLPSLPDHENIVYIIAQHMDPKHDSLLSSLLTASTSMKVNEIKNNQPLVPNEIFITPPGNDILLEGGSFVLQKPKQSIGPKPSVDRFFTSLAEQCEERSIGIILSGTGSDGALGMRAVKASGGITIVQSPESAKYDGMPRAAINTGSVDLVMEVSAIGSELLSIIHSPLLAEERHIEKPAPDDMARLMALLKKHLGHDFSEYKENTIQRRINRRLAVHKLNSLREYVEYAEKNRADLDGLMKDFLISVTEFFRDKEAFEGLRACITQLVGSRKNDQPIRVWVPGCSSGEEVYSIAFLFAQIIEESNKKFKLQIYATDIDGDMVSLARKGIYPDASLINIDQTIRDRYFKSDNGEFQVIKSIREQIVFAKQDIIHDPPFTRMDLIACRNLLIYFNGNLQDRLIAKFHYALNPRGILFLGKSESIGQHNDLFSAINKKWRIFKQKDTAKTLPATFQNSHFLYTGLGQKGYSKAIKKEISNKDIIEQAISTAFGPPSVLVNEQMQLLYAKGDCQKYFEIAEGNVGLNIFDLIKGELRAPLRTTIGKAVRENGATTSRNNRLTVSGSSYIYIDIHAHGSGQVDIPEGFVLVSFIENTVQPLQRESETSADYKDLRIVELEHELAAAHERLQTTVEELETSNEELQSLNEELQSANEELQSTNEELETSNEELQATNEELATVNEEMQIRSGELSEANADLENILKRMGIPLVVLDMELRIRRYTPAIENIFNIMPGDKGQFIANLGSYIVIAEFKRHLERVLKSGAFYQEIVQNTQKFYEMRIYPYYDERNVINGLLISFYDITLASQREQEFRALAENAPDIVTRFDREFRHLYINKTIERYSEKKRSEFISRTNRELGMPDELCTLWEQEVGRVFDSGKEHSFQFDFPSSDGLKCFDSRIAPEYSPDGNISSAMVISRDITNLKEAQKEYENTLKSISDGFFVLDEKLRIQYFNEAAGKLLGRIPDDVLGTALFESFPEANGSIFEKHYRQVLKNKEKLTFETYFDKEPYKNWYNVSVYPKDKGISVYFQVTTEQKNNQLEIERQKEQFQAIVDNIPVFILLYDADVNTLLINKEFELKTGWLKEEIDSENIMEKCYPDPEYRERARSYMSKLSTEWQEFSVQTKSGKSIDTIWSNVQLNSGVQIGIGIDISDKKELEQLLQRKVKLEAIGTLAGGVAHDFNNCLATIIGFAELALDKNQEQGDYRDDLREVLTAGNRARELVKQILTFSKSVPAQKEAVAVDRIMSDAIKMLSPIIPSSIKVEQVCSSEEIVIMADPTRIHQVIMNLCNNGVDAMRETGGVLKISVDKLQREQSTDPRIRKMISSSLMKLEISDTGAGIEGKHIEKLFDPYFSTKGPGYGSGLGLAVVDGIVRDLDGKIIVESMVGRGSVITVYLPLPNEVVAVELPSQREIRDTSSQNGGYGRILFVDDDPAIVKMMKKRLTRLGYKVSDFSDCRNALTMFKKSPQDFDLVITDMTMPEMTGDRFARAIKEITPEIPVILCTGHSEKTLPDKMSDIGIDAFLMKPIDFLQLTAMIKQNLKTG